MKERLKRQKTLKKGKGNQYIPIEAVDPNRAESPIKEPKCQKEGKTGFSCPTYHM